MIVGHYEILANLPSLKRESNVSDGFVRRSGALVAYIYFEPIRARRHPCCVPARPVAGVVIPDDGPDSVEANPEAKLRVTWTRGCTVQHNIRSRRLRAAWISRYARSSTASDLVGEVSDGVVACSFSKIPYIYFDAIASSDSGARRYPCPPLELVGGRVIPDDGPGSVLTDPEAVLGVGAARRGRCEEDRGARGLWRVRTCAKCWCGAWRNADRV